MFLAVTVLAISAKAGMKSCFALHGCTDLGKSLIQEISDAAKEQESAKICFLYMQLHFLPDGRQ
jgi:hypothetical protein